VAATRALTPIALALVALAVPRSQAEERPTPPKIDHVVIVIEENKDFEDIMEGEDTPYIQSLAAEGAWFRNFYAEEHHSQGNYFWLFSGDDQGVGFYDQIPDEPISAHNLAERLQAAYPDTPIDQLFVGYSEDLPEAGSLVEKSGDYARKHVPWASFSNLDQEKVNRPWTDWPTDYDQLPLVAVVIPNLVHDMHSGKDQVKEGDTWLREHLDDYREWARTHDSLLIVTFDENSAMKAGYTDPARCGKRANRIATVIDGAHVRHREDGYKIGPGVTHVNLLRTLEWLSGASPSGAQAPKASDAGIGEDPITEVFDLP